MIKLEIEFKTFEELQSFLARPSISPGDGRIAKITTKPPQTDDTQEDHHDDDRSENVPTADFATVKQAILDLSKSKGRDAAIGVLGQFKDKNGAACAKVTAVLESDYGALLEAVKKVA